MNWRTRDGQRRSNVYPMAEKLTEDDDDDEGFGDFKFVSYHPTHTFHSDQINGRDDDEWGDFINHSSKPSENFDPFGGISDQHSESITSRAESEKSTWAKPSGALPLSIFGDDEDDEGSGDVNSNIGDGSNLFVHNHVDSARSESKINASVTIKDVIVNLYSQMEQIKSPNEPDLNSNGPDSGSNYVVSLLDSNGLNSSSDKSNLAVNGSNSSEVNRNVNGFDSGLNDLNSEFVDFNEDFEEGDGGWEFKTADMTTGGEYLKFEGHGASDSSALKVESPAVQNGLVLVRYTKTTHNGMENGLESHALDVNADADDDVWEFKDASSKTLEKHEEEGKADYLSHNGVEALASDGEVQDTSSEIRSKHGDIRDFNDSLLESRSKHEEESMAADRSPSGFEAFTSDETLAADRSPSGFEAFTSDETPGNKMKSEHRKGALPLFFGDEMPDADASMNLQDVFNYKPTSHPVNSTYSHGSNVPINDLILNLYSQAEQTSSADHTKKLTENGLNSNQKVLASDMVKGDDDFDDSSWEFKDAFSETRVEGMNPVSLQDIDKNSTNTSEQGNFVDFYTKLKDKLCLVARCHLDALKNDESVAALSNEGATAGAFDEEIQEAYKELEQDYIFPDEVSLDSRPPSHPDLDEFVKVLNQPKYQVLNSEFHLSSKLLLAEKELKSAIELLKHAAAMLKILRLGSEKHSVSTWLKMISACAQELKHGALIWKQSLQRNVQLQMLSEPQGQKFILALGEIYRVIEVIGASAKLYKPWMLLDSGDFIGIFALMEECFNVWSSSGLQEALQSLSDPIGFEYDGTAKALLGSIQYIHDLDATSLRNNVFSQQEQPTCKLSLLTQGALPGMKLVAWNGEHYFLKVANLWANLVNCDPPKLPCKSVGP